MRTLQLWLSEFNDLMRWKNDHKMPLKMLEQPSISLVYAPYFWWNFPSLCNNVLQGKRAIIDFTKKFPCVGFDLTYKDDLKLKYLKNIQYVVISNPSDSLDFLIRKIKGWRFTNKNVCMYVILYPIFLHT